MAAQPPPSAALAPPPGFLQRWWQRLTAPSPRSLPELSADLWAQGLNGLLDRRFAGAASASHVGEAVMDCLYAMGEPTGAASSPFMRLLQAVSGLFGRLIAAARRPPPPGAESGPLGEMRVGSDAR